jgi:hypothetical protein
MAKRLRTDDIQLNITIKSNKAQAELGELDRRAVKLRDEMKGLKKGTEEYAAKSRELSQVKNRMDELRKEVGLTALSMRQLNARARELRQMRQHITPGTAEFKKVDNELHSINARMKELRVGGQQAGRSLAQSAGSIKTSWVAIGAAIFGAFRTAGSFVDSFRQQEKAINQVSQALVSTAGAAGLSLRELADEASRLQNESTFGDESILENLTMRLLTYTDIQGEMFKKGQQAALDMSAALGQDLATSAETVGKALNYPSHALSALSEQGFRFTDEQQQLIKHFEKTNQLVKAQEIILGELNLAYGGQAEALARGAGAMDQARNKVRDLHETFGKLLTNAIMPVYRWFGNLAERLNTTLTHAFKSSNEVFDDHLDKVARLQIDIVPLLDRYDDLTTKTTLSTNEQNELSSIIEKITGVLPGVSTGFDLYGKAVSLSTDRVREFVDQQRALLQYQNRAAIAEIEKDINKVNQQLAKIAPDIEAIEKTGTFQVFRRYFDQQTQQWVEGWRDASRQQVQDVVNTNTKLLFERSGMMARLETLNGDSLKKEIDRREDERKAAQELEQKRVEYRKKSIQELEQMASGGDELAEQILAELRANANETNQIIRSTYQQLTAAISEGREALVGFVADNNWAAAEQQQASLQVLESQKTMIDKIIQAGGSWEAFMTQLRDDEFIKIMEQNKLALDEFLEGLDDDIALELAEAIEAAAEANDEVLEGFKKIGSEGKKISEEWKNAGISSAHAIANASIDIFRNSLAAQTAQKLDSLARQKDEELSGKNLTEKEKAEIEEKFRKQQAAIKTQEWIKMRNAAIIESIIGTALAVIQALPNIPLAIAVGIMGAAKTAVIASQEVPQFAKGRYDVIGADDNQLYRQVPFTGKAMTGIYHSPALVAEKGDELIIDNPTLRNIRVNFPEVLQAIQLARVPQHAAGSYSRQDLPKPENNMSTILGQLSELIKINSIAISDMKIATKDLNQEIQKGIRSKVIYQEFEHLQKIIKRTEEESML